MTRLSILVRTEWDPEAGVFVASSEDIPGLVAEAATPQEMLQKLEILIPELLELNGAPASESHATHEIPLYVMHQQVSKIRIPA